MKTHIATALMLIFAFGLGYTLRGDLIYSGMFKNTVRVAAERELPVKGKPNE